MSENETSKPKGARKPPAPAKATGPRGTFKAKFTDPSAVEWGDPELLLEHPDNWRLHPDHQRQIMQGVLVDLGWTDRVKVSRRAGRHDLIVDGHLRTMLARAAGELVPLEPLTMTDEEERMALASHDSLTALSDTDYEALQRTLSGIGHAGGEAVGGLFDDLEAQINDALAMKKQYEGRTETNFNSVQKSFAARKVVIKAVYALEEAELFETALEATGEINRAKAMQILASSYLRSKGIRYDGDSADQLDRSPEDRLAEDIARSLGG
jgi:hypothetical protein